MKKIVAFLLMFCLCFACIAAIDLDGHMLHAEEDLGGDDGHIDPDDPGHTDPEIPVGPNTPTPLLYVTLDEKHPPVYAKVGGVPTLTVRYIVVISDRGAISSGTLAINPITQTQGQTGYTSVSVQLGAAKVLGGRLFGQTISATQYPSPQIAITVGPVSAIESDKAFTAYTRNDPANLSWLEVSYPVTRVYNPLLEVDFCKGSSIVRSGVRYTPNAEDIRFNGNLSVYVCEHPSYAYVTTREANCKVAGNQEYRCVVCQMKHPTQGDKVVMPTSHTLDYTHPYNTELYQAVAPTCTAEGSGYFRCIICDKYEYAAAPKLDHKWGTRYLDTNTNTWKQRCSTCNTVRSADNQCNHPAENYELVKVETASTCTVAGVGLFRCPICGVDAEETRNLPLAQHTVAEWVVDKVASCSQEGSKKGSCSTCKQEVTLTIAKLEHVFGAWKTTKASTCVEDGERTRTCENCASVIKETVGKSGHAYGAWEVMKEATCAAEGETRRNCANCDSFETKSIEKLPHVYGTWTVSSAPTCTESGTEKRTCTACGDEELRTIDINPDAHKYGDWKSIAAKTCTADGEKERVCEYCGHVDKDVDPCTGHQFGEYTTNKKVKTRTCIVCAYTESEETVKKGIVKILACVDGYVTIEGDLATQNVAFEMERMSIDDERYNYYKENISFETAYIFKLTVDGKPVKLTDDIKLTITMDPSMEDYEATLAVLRDRRVFAVTELERKGLSLSVGAANVDGAEAIFVQKSDEKKPNVAFPIIIVALTLVIGGGAAYLFVIRGKRDNGFV